MFSFNAILPKRTFKMKSIFVSFSARISFSFYPSRSQKASKLECISEINFSKTSKRFVEAHSDAPTTIRNSGGLISKGKIRYILGNYIAENLPDRKFQPSDGKALFSPIFADVKFITSYSNLALILKAVIFKKHKLFSLSQMWSQGNPSFFWYKWVLNVRIIQRRNFFWGGWERIGERNSSTACALEKYISIFAGRRANSLNSKILNFLKIVKNFWRFWKNVEKIG